MASVTAAMSASESSSSEVLVLSIVSASSLSNSCSPAIEKCKNIIEKVPKVVQGRFPSVVNLWGKRFKLHN